MNISFNMNMQNPFQGESPKSLVIQSDTVGGSKSEQLAQKYYFLYHSDIALQGVWGNNVVL